MTRILYMINTDYKKQNHLNFFYFRFKIGSQVRLAADSRVNKKVYSSD